MLWMGNWVVRRAVFQPPNPTYRVDGKVYLPLVSEDGGVVPVSMVSSEDPRFAII